LTAVSGNYLIKKSLLHMGVYSQGKGTMTKWSCLWARIWDECSCLSAWKKIAYRTCSLFPEFQENRDRAVLISVIIYFSIDRSSLFMIGFSVLMITVCSVIFIYLI
jgi:hypothetical protein